LEPPVDIADRDAATTFVGVVMKYAKGRGDHLVHYYWNDVVVVDVKEEGVDKIHDHSH